MIYLYHTTGQQEVFVPRNYRTGTYDGYSLGLVSTVDLTETIVPLAEVKPAGDYLDCILTLPHEMQTGEYQYTLRGDREELSTGVAVVVWEEEDVKEFKEEIQYIQYE